MTRTLTTSGSAADFTRPAEELKHLHSRNATPSLTYPAFLYFRPGRSGACEARLWGKRTTRKTDRVELTYMVLATHRESAAQKELFIVSDVAPSVPEILIGDPRRLERILSNLVGNAIRFTERGQMALFVQSQSDADDQNELHFSVVGRHNSIRIAQAAFAQE